MTFLGNVVSKNVIMVDPRKIKVLYDWKRPITLFEVSSFISLVGYFAQFIEGFATIVVPMTRFTKREVSF